MPAQLRADPDKASGEDVALAACKVLPALCIGPRGLRSHNCQAVEPLAELDAPVCCVSGGTEVAAQAVEPLVELNTPACCVSGGPEVAAQAVEQLAELNAPACCVSGCLEVAAQAVEPTSARLPAA